LHREHKEPTMNPTDLAILEAVRGAAENVGGIRTARLVRPDERVEVPLSRYPAVLVEPERAEALTWLDVPSGRYHLRRFGVTVLDRALPGTRAHEALVARADAVRSAVAALGTVGGLAEDGPPSAADDALAPPAGAVRVAPAEVRKPKPGEPTAVRIAGAAGYWAHPFAGGATLDGEALFDSGPHVVLAGSPVRRVKDVAFNGLSGGLALDLGDGPREIVQRGVLSAPTPEGLALLEAAVEAFIDGRAYTVEAPEGTEYAACRLERFERLGAPLTGLALHRPYRLTYRQLAR
jgi:hypothetical protein